MVMTMGIGFWKGKIELKMDRFRFGPGDVIEGDLILTLKKPTKARGIHIRLIGEEKTTERRYEEGHSRTETRTHKIFDLKVPLDGEKEYSEGKYHFKVPIPRNLFEEGEKPEGFLGDVVGALESLSGRRSRIEWTLIGNLDIPMGFDLSKKQSIVIDRDGKP
ncbi:MAG: hypothetical protein JW939_08175 [Candidatus Thermoplasmatota archaeon]|nr:hypothetical protein [Candidatus Thermoplasmatota archaeon]